MNWHQLKGQKYVKVKADSKKNLYEILNFIKFVVSFPPRTMVRYVVEDQKAEIIPVPTSSAIQNELK